jgi:tRNA pseudouridine55 synthase
MNGFLLVDKAGGMTSHDVVAKVRRRFATKKVGHAGTLDPMATGVLVIGIGNATRLLQYVVEGKKAYDATILIGKATVTDDAEGEIIFTAEESKIAEVTDEMIRCELSKMVGNISQRPSSVSAIKIDGKTAHQRVRAGEKVELPSREVTIESIDIHAINRGASSIEISVSVTCSAGTYIRAIARDLGDALEVGGHLTHLRRTRVDPFDIAECQSWESAEPIATSAGIARILPIRRLDPQELNEISFGRVISASPESGITAGLTSTGDFAALLENKELAGVTMATPTLVSVKE